MGRGFLMKFKRFLRVILMMLCCVALLAGCGDAAPAVSADMSYAQTDISSVTVPDNVQVVGLGEASHGASEYHQMKSEVFKALVANNGCRSFIIEGDFGGALKVDEYIHGGNGTAEEAVGEIGFAIYRTQEMSDLVDWMRAYNENVPAEESLHFYGMDTQRFDNNKEYLFNVLDEAAPELSAKYQEEFSALTDENRLSLDDAALNKGKEAASSLMEEMDAAQADMVNNSEQAAFDFARECVNSIYACCDIQLSTNYNATRDQHMFEKVEWFQQHGDGSVLFVNGHNGHIGKTSVAGYTCVGKLLTEKLGDDYYAIGTDAQVTEFNSQTNTGFEVVKVSNENELNCLLDNSDQEMFFVDFANATADEAWNKMLNSEQTITTLNVSLSGMQKMMKFAYTTKIVPEKIFDGMIVFKKVSPTTIIE